MRYNCINEICYNFKDRDFLSEFQIYGLFMVYYSEFQIYGIFMKQWRLQALRDIKYMKKTTLLKLANVNEIDILEVKIKMFIIHSPNNKKKNTTNQHSKQHRKISNQDEPHRSNTKAKNLAQ